jgi:hypothetical protein
MDVDESPQPAAEASNARPYRVIAGQRARRFEITGGLISGYGPAGARYDLDDVCGAHHAWQRETHQILGCLIAPATISYGYEEDAGRIQGASEPGFVLCGLINPLYQAHLSDAEVGRLVDDLARYLAGALGQRRIYVSVLGQHTILEALPDDAPRFERENHERSATRADNPSTEPADVRIDSQETVAAPQPDAEGPQTP